MDNAIEEAQVNARVNKERWDNRQNHVYGRVPSPQDDPQDSLREEPGPSVPPLDPKGKEKSPVRVQTNDGAADDEGGGDLYDTAVVQSIEGLQGENRVVSRVSNDTEE